MVHIFPRRACIHQHTAAQITMAHHQRRHRQGQREAVQVRLMDRRISWRGSLRLCRIPRRGDLIRMILPFERVSRLRGDGLWNANSCIVTEAALAMDKSKIPRPYKCPLCDRAFYRLEHQVSRTVTLHLPILTR